MDRATAYIKDRDEAALQAYKTMLRDLPHMNTDPDNGGIPMYAWQWDFYQSKNRMLLLTAANQIGKSSIQIRKDIHWATEPKLWPLLWPTSHHNVAQFWYLYPTLDVATIEFQKKWVPEWLPRNSMKKDSQYGWEAEMKAKKINALHFNTGVSIYFKSYAQQAQDLQTGTCFTKGTLISTSNGLEEIQSLKVGDLVLTRYGYRKIINTFETKKTNKILVTENRSEVRSTAEHPFWVDDFGWKQFGTLKRGEYLLQLPGWKLIKKLYYLKASCTRVTQKIKILEEKTTLDLVEEKVFTLLFGSLTIRKNFLMAMSFIMLITTHLITRFQTLFAGLSKSILRITSLRSGKLESGKTSSVSGVEVNLNQDLHKEEHQDTAHNRAGKKHIVQRALKKLVHFVAKSLSRQRIVLKRGFARGNAQTISTVYNIEVEGNPEYFANGFLVHNCHKISTDEELPIGLYDELKFRTSATNGHFSMAFTATLGQYEWECAMEKRGESEELFPKAHKIQVSLYDCLQYTDSKRELLRHKDGKVVRTPWTKEIIQDRIDSCSSKDEVQKRIYGRFVQSGGLKYAQHLNEENLIEDWVFDDNYSVYSATDPGSGGKSGHPSGIVFIAVSPNCEEGIVFLGWRGDNIPTTAGDTLNQYIEMKGKLKVATQFYDYKDKDFAVLGERIGESFQKAEKSHEIGEPILKTLLKYKALKFVTGNVIGLEKFDTETREGEVLKLLSELRGLKEGIDKRQAKDDLIDPTRYICAKVPWDIDKIIKNRAGKILTRPKKVETVLPKTTAESIKERREMFIPKDVQDDFDSEIDFWNEMM